MKFLQQVKNNQKDIRKNKIACNVKKIISVFYKTLNNPIFKLFFIYDVIINNDFNSINIILKKNFSINDEEIFIYKEQDIKKTFIRIKGKIRYIIGKNMVLRKIPNIYFSFTDEKYE